MDALNLHRIKTDLTRDGIVFLYCGYVTEAVLEGIGAALRTKLGIDRADRGVAKGVFSIFVEQVQNVVRYSAEREQAEEGPGNELRFGILSVGRNETGYFVSCGNVILDKDVEPLRANLERLRGLERPELMALYKETLKKDSPEGSKGAGVGFMEIARLAAGGLAFDFARIDEGKSFFTVTAYL